MRVTLTHEMNNTNLNLYRRHLKGCKLRSKGQNHINCSCPIWCDGELNGKRYRHSLKTRDWQRAIRKKSVLEDPKLAQVKPVIEAIRAFENHIQSLESSTRRKYGNVLRQFATHCEQTAIEDL